MLHMREQILRALLAHAQGDIAKHKANVEVYLEHPAGVGEHTDILESIENLRTGTARIRENAHYRRRPPPRYSVPPL